MVYIKQFPGENMYENIKLMTTISYETSWKFTVNIYMNSYKPKVIYIYLDFYPFKSLSYLDHHT